MANQAYANYSNFVQPVRRPQSSIFQLPKVPSQGIPIIFPLPCSSQQSKQKAQSAPSVQSVRSARTSHVAPHLLSSHQRLENIQHDKEDLFRKLRDNDRLEREVKDRNDLARKQEEDDRLSHISGHVSTLRKELEEKEQMESWLRERQESDRLTRERRNIDELRNQKEQILKRIQEHEQLTVRLKEQEEEQELAREREKLQGQWKEREREREFETDRLSMEKDSRERTESERQDLENDEIQKLRRDSEELRRLLQHRENQEQLLSKRIEATRHEEDIVEAIRTEKRKQLEERKSKSRSSNRTKTVVHQGRRRSRNTPQDDIDSDSDMYDTVKAMNGSKSRTSHRSSAASSSVGPSASHKSIRNNMTAVSHLLREPSGETDSLGDIDEIIEQTRFLEAPRKDQAPKLTEARLEQLNRRDETEILEYDKIMQKLVKDMERQQHRVQDPKQQAQLATMVQACSMMQKLCGQDNTKRSCSDTKIKPTGDSVRRDPSVGPTADELPQDILGDLGIGTIEPGEPLLPSESIYLNNIDEEGDRDIRELHRQVIDIKGILKEG